MVRSVALLSALLGLSACAEGRWVHPTHTEDQAKQDWEICKAEVLSGQEHAKDTMAGGINLSGCMKSKGYTYVEAQPQQPPTPLNTVPR
jgi:hypothetical protein